MQFKYNGRRLVYSFGQTIDKSNWNPAKQRVKSNKNTTADGDHSLNELLDNLKEVCEKSYKTEIKNGAPTTNVLKNYLVNFINQNKEKPKQGPTLFNLIDRFISGEIKNKGKEKSKASLNNYRSVKIHLQDFDLKKNYKVDFDTVNLDFFYKYTSFLKKDLKLSVNTIAKDISILKVFMGEAVDLGFSTNYQFRHKKFSYSEEETDAVYLKENEIMRLYRYDLAKHKKLDRVKDLFVFGCFVGLRFSDYSNVKPGNIITIDEKLFIKLITQKTKELVIIPCNPVVLEIFKKYESNPNKLTKSISNQKFNEYVKEVCKKAGLKETGRLSTRPELELWQCLSSHTARRSFATNLYLEGYPTIEIMKVTGHKTERAFMKYIRVNKLDSALRLSKFIELKWTEKILRAV